MRLTTEPVLDTQCFRLDSDSQDLQQVGGHVARDTDRIEREIEAARSQLASTLDELSVRASPKRIAENTKQSIVAKLNEPPVKFTLIGVGAVVAVLVVRKIFS